MRKTRILSFIILTALILNLIPASAIAAAAEEKHFFQLDDAEPYAPRYVETSSSPNWNALKNYLEQEIKKCSPKIDISSYNIESNDENIDKIKSIVLYSDDPEITLNILSYCFQTSWSTITTIEPGYKYSKSKYTEMINQSRAAADKLLEGIKGSSLSDLEKALLIHDRLVLHCEYMNGDNDNNIYGGLVEGKVVCSGYSFTYNYLLNQVGIKNEIGVSVSLFHDWNIVYIDGVPYHVDVTWDDPTMNTEGEVNHDNFLISSEAFYNTGHRAYDYDTSPQDTRYDDYFWHDSESEFQLLNGEIYYIDNVNGKLKRFSDQKVLCDLSDNWSYYSGSFSRLASDGNSLFYSMTDSIYKFNPDTLKSEKICEPTLPFTSNYSIYGMTYNDGYLSYALHDSPDFMSWQKAPGHLRFLYNPDKVFDYKVKSDGSLEITGYKGSGTDVCIPSEINGRAVTGIADAIFDKYNNLVLYGEPNSPVQSYAQKKGIIFRDIEETFYGYSETDENSVIIDCYYGDSETLNIPKTLGGKAVNAIGDCAISGLKNVSSVSIPETVTEIGRAAFGNCPNLTELNVSENNKFFASIDGVLFSKDISNLITYPQNKSDTAYAIPNGVTEISANTFTGCKFLESINIPDGIKSIGDEAFAECTNLSDITIPDSVEKIGICAFENTEYYDNSDNWEIDGDLINDYSQFLYIGNHLISGYANGEITVRPETKTIAGRAFSSAYSMESVNLPEGLKGIGDGAFYSCMNLKSINIPDSVTNIGQEAFFNCQNLESITIPKKVKSLEYYTFFGCSSLKNVFFLSGKTTISYDTFALCPSDMTFYSEPGGAVQTFAIENGINFSNINSLLYSTEALPDGTLRIKSYNGSETEIVIPEIINGKKVTSIAANAFSGHENIISITVPNSIKEISSDAFAGCPDGFIIRSRTGTAAEAFAMENGIPFEEIISLLGDVDGDGDINAADATMVLQKYAGIIQNELPTADVNNDGAINSADATLILQKYAGIIQKF